MSRCVKQVPPLEMCKMIPEGEFEDSLWVWRKGYQAFPISIELRTPYTPHKQIPAPTLQEILEKLPGTKSYYDGRGRWYVSDTLGTVEECSENPAKSALKLWLKSDHKRLYC